MAAATALDAAPRGGQAASVPQNGPGAASPSFSTTLVTQIADRCPAETSPSPANAPSWAGWSPDPDNWRYQPAHEAGISAGDVPHLKLKWAFGIPNVKMVRSQPAIYRGRVYLGANDGTVYALDAATGCTFWATTIPKPVRSGIAIGKAGAATAVFFGDAGGGLTALNAATGELLWHVQPDAHPAATITGTPSYLRGRLYVPMSSAEEQFRRRPTYECCTFRGNVVAVDAATGKTIWKTYMAADAPSPQGKTPDGRTILGPSGMAIWSSPTLDAERHRVYVGTGDNYSAPHTATSDAVVALDMTTGKLLWSHQFSKEDIYRIECGNPPAANCAPPSVPEFDLGASPILVKLPSGKRVLLLGQKSGLVYAVDPDDGGRLLWHQRAGAGGLLGGVQWGPATDGSRFYVAVSDLSFLPGMRGIDPTKGGGISAYRADTGALLWKTPAPGCGDRRPCSPAQSQAISAIPGAVFSGSLDGHLRAYDESSGKVIWDFDTAQPFQAVNGVPAKGGSLDVGGPVIAGGMMFVVSGYPGFGAMPGNVLLAFAAR